MDWNEFIQNATQQVIDTRLAVYQYEKIPHSIDPASGVQYRDGQPVGGALAGLSPLVLLGGGAAVLLAVLLLKD